MAIIAIFLVNCKKEPGKGVVVSTYMNITYIDNAGRDLLDPSTPNYFSASGIHVFNFVKGIKKEVYHTNYDLPQNFNIYKSDPLKNNSMMLSFETDTTLLQLNQSTTDTITCIIDKSNGSWILKKVWYNGDLKWDDLMLPQETTIVK